MKRRRVDTSYPGSAVASNAMGYGYDFGKEAVPIIRPVESTLAIDVGNINTNQTNPYYGLSPDVVLSGVMSGVKTIQYDEFFSMDDQYTFNPENCMIGLVVLVYYDPASTPSPPPPDIRGRYGLWIIPITLPWKKMSFGNLFANSTPFAGSDPQVMGTNTEGRDVLHRLQDQLVYALNTMWNFTQNPSGGSQPNQANIPGGNGWVLSKEYFNQIDKPDFMYPMWTDGIDPLPLIWFRGPNGELGIKRNGYFGDGSLYGKARISMNFMSIPTSFLQNNNFYERNLNHTLNPDRVEDCPGPSIIASMFGDEKGWIGGGPYVFGIGNFLSNNSINGYRDDYYNNPEIKNQIFNLTTYVHQEDGIPYPTLANYDAYHAFAKSLLLKEEICMGTRVASLIPSRFMTVCSQNLTRNLRLPCESNNSNAAASDIIGIVFPQTNVTSVYGKTNTLQNFIDPFETNTNPVIYTLPTDPKQILDFQIKDENLRFIKNANPNILNESFYLLGNTQRNFYPPKNFTGELVLPAIIKALNPDTVTYPDGDCLLTAQHLSQLSFFQTYVDESNIYRTNNITSNNFSITCSEASWMSHFIRLFGNTD